MRTRLDEIVDEFIRTYKSGDPAFRNCLVESHDRAFRHGVEESKKFFDEKFSDAYDTAYRLMPEIVSSFPAQPAPTEEKWPKKGGFHAPWCIDDAHLFGPCCCDRRKGERRRHEETISDDRLFNTDRRYIGSGRLIWEGLDRRSGKDRRRG